MAQERPGRWRGAILGIGAAGLMVATILALWRMPPEAMQTGRSLDGEPQVEGSLRRGTVPDAVPAPATPMPLATGGPSFDQVRVARDGSAVISGRAAPGAEVTLRVEGVPVAVTSVDANGSFAAMVTFAPAATPRLLTLAARTSGGVEVVSDAHVIVDPPAPVVALSGVRPEPKQADTAAGPFPAGPPVASCDRDGGPGCASLGGGPAAALPTIPNRDPGIEADVSQPGAILVTPRTVRVLQPAGGSAAVSIDAVSYGPAGDVRLAGRAASGSTVRIYLDAAMLADFAAGPDGGWGGVLPDVAPGLHTLRADQIGADGTVTGRFETPFQRETADILATARMADGVEPPSRTPGATGEDDRREVPQTAPPVMTGPAGTLSGDPAWRARGDPVTAPGSREAMSLAAPPGRPPPGAQDKGPGAGLPVTVTVQPGFTLWAIARDRFGDGLLYVQVFRANRDRIRDPDLIYPGQVFRLPERAR